jgi:flagellar hook-length control protein FliK
MNIPAERPPTKCKKISNTRQVKKVSGIARYAHIAMRKPPKMENIMINQLFTAQQPAPQGKNIKSDAPAAKKADTTAANSPKSNDPFGAVLAKQIADKKSDSADKTTHQVTGDAVETKKEASKAVTEKTESGTIATISDQPLSTLNALLFGNQVSTAAALPPDGKATDGKTADLISAGSQATPGGKKLAYQPDTTVSEKALQTASTAAETTLAASAQATPPSEFKAELLKATEPDLAPHADTASAQASSQTAGSIIASAQLPDTRRAEVQTTITAPLGSNVWPDEFSQKVTWVCNQQNQVAELHLNPPDLGPISIVLSVADNQASAVFTSPHSSVREAIENAMPKLRESLAENGIMLGNATVSDQAPRDNRSNNFTQPRSQTVNGKSEVAINAPAITAPVITHQHKGMVDTFA